MSIKQDNIDMTRVGPGTVMGNFMREYWIPAAKSSELGNDGTPMRLMLLGEKLVAFRDSSGRVGVMDHLCPHRCASLVLGRNEENGIRCIYHGWKFDVDGNCVEMPSVAPSQDFKEKVKAKAYKAVDRNGIIWVYMGPRKQPPPLPKIEATLLLESEVDISFTQRDCNWLQALEGDIDTSHFGFLHAGSAEPEDFQDDHPMRHTVTNRAPEYHVADTDWGTSYGAYRLEENGSMSWRIANFVFPFWTQAPNSDFLTNVGVRAWVPMDDEHTMVVLISWKKSPGAYTGMPLKNGKAIPGFAPTIDYLPNTNDWFGRWRPIARWENDFEIDRDAQRLNIIYSGIKMVFMQDQAVTESMGGITDHAFEHLVSSDQMIARTRRRVLKAALSLQDEGKLPPGVSNPEAMWRARSGTFHTEAHEDWQVAYEKNLKNAVRVISSTPLTKV